MTFLQLNLVVGIEQMGSISAAAQSLRISQPNASSCLKRLEEELNCTLFMRSENKIVPTEQGKLFIEHAKKIIREDKAMRAVCRMEKISRLRVGIMNYTPANDAFVRFCGEHTDAVAADFSCISLSFEDSMHLLRENAIDLAVCFVVKAGIERDIKLCTEENLKLDIIRDVPICLRFRENHPLVDELTKEPSLENLCKLNQYPYVDFSNIDQLLQIYNTSSSHAFGYSYRILVSNHDMRLKTISCTNAYTIGAPLPKAKCNEYHIVNIPIGSEKSSLVTIMRADSTITDDISRYLELLNEELDKALSEFNYT